jgi:hypothetical protein
MKKFIFIILVIGIVAPVFAQTQTEVSIPEYTFASGSWSFSGPRLYQNNEKSGLAKANFRVPQNGIMLYKFNVRYEGGAEDGHGGAGIHIFVDNAVNRASWGAGKSYLLWLNYDEKPLSKDIPAGLSAQVYRSVNNSRMELMVSTPLAEYEPLLTIENLKNAVSFRIIANGDTGEVRVYDPTDPSNRKYFVFFMDKKDLPIKGSFVALRTNGIKLSFAMEN